MKICPNCHEEMSEEAKFCTNCGFDLTQKTFDTFDESKVVGSEEDSQEIMEDSEVISDNSEAIQSDSKTSKQWKYYVVLGFFIAIIFAFIFSISWLNSEADNYQVKEESLTTQKLKNDVQMKKWSEEEANWTQSNDEESLDNMQSMIKTYQSDIELAQKQLEHLAKVAEPLNKAYDTAEKVQNSDDFTTVFDATVNLYQHQRTNGATDFDGIKAEFLGGIE
ncbi:zinc ribbon domain-containing protein [Enterococcus dongliensis]|uniref:zinc ribbon domain-containing protein n=1 Tax=Enterococcus dongliensis TaxID=2559925 RepID=UPI002890EFF0|nr:zinc ribbon domain-containing protein [Enterococcus dongliensis]MDT2634756.1 zinc ribbon domain-containing protein [Enterococcus dongliensis]MDT2645441.1 zinc ribbon domain-containing protein [Enterococcus dongliensis]MDT2677005.1 zinc ribbon domain-containing protein [Enterococcus dongliensis]